MNAEQQIKRIAWLRDDIIGQKATIKTRFGEKPLLYADYTASGRSLHSVENFITSILPYYANTHTDDDYTGKLMSDLLHQAESKIKHYVNAGTAGKVIPVGTGATGAIQRLLSLLGVYLPPTTERTLEDLIHSYSAGLTEDQDKVLKALDAYIGEHRPVVFVGPYEHHSNEIMWRQGLCEVIEIPLDKNGELDLLSLEANLSSDIYKDRVKIGSFSAASNVTGILTDVHEVAKIVHRHGGIACFDFAACAPYVEINMSPGDEGYLDAIVFSPHKFLGGPGSSGVLVFNEKIYQSDLPPSVAGGGTVAYVTSQEEMFLDDIEERELAGTPGILQTIRVALCMQVKDKVGAENIELIEKYFLDKIVQRFSGNDRIEIYGPQDPDKRINIIPFNIKHHDRILHPKFVTKLFSDLFGIQTRAGCSCAGPYGHKVLGISDEHSQCLIHHLQESRLYGLKPGWVRFNLHYAFSIEEMDYLLDATEFIVNHVSLFLRDYQFDYLTGEWNAIDGEQSARLQLTIEQADLPETSDWSDAEMFSKQMAQAQALIAQRRESDHYEPDLTELHDFMFFYAESSINLQK